MSHLTRRSVLASVLFAGSSAWTSSGFAQVGKPPGRLQSWPLKTPRTTGIHDLAPAPDGGVWFTAQRSGHLGWFDPKDGHTELIALGSGSSPHGVIQGPDGAAWITDSGLNAIVRVSWPHREVRRFALPEGTPYANLNTCAFDGDGDLWFTGQSGLIGKVAVKTGTVTVRDAPGGRGPYGICSTPRGDVWWCSLAGSLIARIDRRTGDSVVVQPPTINQGARRVWSDRAGRIWVSEWNSGQLSMHDPANGSWRAWKPHSESPRCYAVYVDERDMVWVAEWSSNAVFSFDPAGERWHCYGLPRSGAGVRQILGRKGEVWLPESGTEHITVIRTG